MKTAVITGGSVGIGLTLVESYLKAGYKVISISRREMEILSSSHTHLKADLSDWENAHEVCRKICSIVKKLDVLINNVGKSQWMPLDGISEEFFSQMMALNVGSYLSVSQGLLPVLERNSCIINISSLAGKRGTPNNSVYCATKFAINGITQALAKELGPKGIRVNALCPVLIRSEGLEKALVEEHSPSFGLGVDSFLKGFTESQTALRSLPSGEDVANFALFLSSQDASSITGQCINVDCGVLPQ